VREHAGSHLSTFTDGVRFVALGTLANVLGDYAEAVVYRRRVVKLSVSPLTLRPFCSTVTSNLASLPLVWRRDPLTVSPGADPREEAT
jgi:hypothetical protein